MHTHPVTRSSARWPSKTSSTSSMSTFLRHAFLPLRLVCVRCDGAPIAEREGFLALPLAAGALAAVLLLFVGAIGGRQISEIVADGAVQKKSRAAK